MVTLAFGGREDCRAGREVLSFAFRTLAMIRPP